MKKNGFTLIELIATIVILSLIALIVFPAITSMVKSSRDSAYDSQVNIIIKAAKAYYLNNVNSLPEEDPTAPNSSVNIYDLVKQGYISDEELVDVDTLDLTAAEKTSFKTTYGNDTKAIINPKNKKPLEGVVVVSYNSNQYIYEFNDADN